MAAKGMFFAVVLCMAAMTQAAQKTQGGESRLFFTSQDTTATLGFDTIVSIGLLSIGLLFLAALFGLFDRDTTEAVSYTAPTSYAAPLPTYGTEESSYSALRSIDEATKRYHQWNPEQ